MKLKSTIFLRQRLDELEQLQKQIVETDFRKSSKTESAGAGGLGEQMAGGMTEVADDQKSNPPQEHEEENALKQMLLDLTNQMKEKWRLVKLGLQNTD